MFDKLYKVVEKLRPSFEEGGKLHAFHSLFDGFDTFLFTPNTTAKRIGAQIHKRQLKVHGAIEEVQETAPFIKDGCLILLLGKLIIDVLKLNCLGIIV